MQNISAIIKSIFSKRYIKIAAISVILVFLVILSINIYIKEFSGGYIFDSEANIPKADAVLILGASVFSDGRLSDILKDRVITAVRLYQRGKADKILVSGYNRDQRYKEVDSIKTYLSNMGVPEKDMLLDYSGFDTYDSVYRAKSIFKINSLDITTQSYHLPRAIYIARNLGIEAYGLNSDLQTYKKIRLFEFREEFARFKAFIEVSIHAKPNQEN